MATHLPTITNIDRNRDFNLSVDKLAGNEWGCRPRTATIIQQSDIDSVRDVYAKDAAAGNRSAQ